MKNTAEEINERRRFKRIRTAYYLRVYDSVTGVEMGSVVDISEQGLQLIGNSCYPVREHFNLRIILPAGGLLGECIDIPAVGRWTKPSRDGADCATGFEFTEPAGAAIFTIKSLINDLMGSEPDPDVLTR